MSNGSIFSMLREQRLEKNKEAIMEGAEEEKVVTPAEEVETPAPAEETPAPAPEATPVVEEEKEEEKETPETEEEEVTEEISVVCCPHCGILEQLNEEKETEIEACPHCGEEELVEKVVKVVRNGEVVKKKIKTKKTRLTPAQKAALAKARKKAHTAGAEKARKKSNKVRNKKGLNDEDYAECPECGWTGDISELEDGLCPECQAEIKANEEVNTTSVADVIEAISNMSAEELADLKESLSKVGE